MVKEISAKQKWALEHTRVSKLDLRKLRFGTSQRYEFRVGLGKTSLLAKFSDEVGSWKKFRKPKHDFGYLVNEVSSTALLDTFKVEGPLELRVDSSSVAPSLLMPVCLFLIPVLPLSSFSRFDADFQLRTPARACSMLDAYSLAHCDSLIYVILTITGYFHVLCLCVYRYCKMEK